MMMMMMMMMMTMEKKRGLLLMMVAALFILTKQTTTAYELRTGCVPIPERVDPGGQTVPAASIYVREDGKNVVENDDLLVLFVHGTSGSNIYWRCIQDAFVEMGYHALALDLRGQGFSQQTPPSQVHYTYDMFALDIRATLEALGLERKRLAWAGVSIGSSIGVKYNVLFPGSIHLLSLFSFSPIFASPQCAVFDCVLDAVSTPTTMLNEPCQNNPLLIQAQAKIAQNKERAAPMIPSLIEYGWTENQTSELAAIKAPTGISFGSIDSLLGDGGSSWFTHKNVENSVINEHVEKGHLNIISDWKNGVRDMLRLFDMKDIPDFIRILDRGCDVCPLVKPEVMIECSYNSTDYAFPQLGESAPPFRY